MVSYINENDIRWNNKHPQVEQSIDIAIASNRQLSLRWFN